MKKFLKYTGISVCVIFLLLLIAPFLLKGKIIEAVKQAANDNLNAVVNFEDVSLSLIRNFPNLRVKIENFTVDNVAPFDSVRLAKIGSLEAVVDIKSVFGDEIMVRKIGIVNPVFDVRVLADGRANYDIAKADTTTDKEVPADTAAGAFKMKLKEYFIENGMINYNDQSMPLLLKMEGMNHRGSGDFTSDIFVLNTFTTADKGTFWFDGITYINKAKIELKAGLDMDMKNMKFTFKENELKLNELFLKADGWVAMPADDIDMDITFAATKTDFRQLLSMVPAEFAKDISGVDASGKMALDGYVKGTYNETSLPSLGLNVLVENGRFKYPDLPKSVDNIQLKASVIADLNVMDKTTVDVEKFHLEMAQNPVDMTLKLRTPESDPDIDFACKAFIDLDNVKEFIPLEKGDQVHGQINADITLKGRMSSVEKERYDQFDARGMLGIKNVLFKSDSLPYDLQVNDFQLAFTPAYLDLTNFDGRIGKSDLRATGKITDYLGYFLKDSLLVGNFAVQSNLMDLNEFMTEEETTGETVQTTQSEPADTSLSAVELPGNIDFALTANFAKMIYGTNEITNVKGGIALKEKIATLKNLSMNVLDGTVIMSGNYNAQNIQKPKMDFIFDIVDMDINKAANQFNTIDKLAPVAKACNGKFSTKMNLKSDLDQAMMPINQTVNGSGNLSTKNVVIKDFEPLVKLADKINLEELKKAQTVTNINVSFKIKDGVVNVDPYTVKVSDIPFKIYGFTTLDQIIDYNVETDVPFEKFPGNLVNQANSFIGEINKKAGINLSVGKKVNVIARITGTMTDPKIGVTSKLFGENAVNDLKQQAVEAIKQEVVEQVTNLKNEALERAIAEKEKLVAEAQRQADKLKSEGQSAAQKLKDEAYKLAKQTEDKAKNPLEKIAAKAAADKIRKEADVAFNKSTSEVNKRADKLVQEASAHGDKMIQDASAAGDKQIEKAK
ncbi:MAG: hypothetical protein IT223_08115 [Crocinitomicaceae bacterium]|nr:hypothetical protein [Crocinitomicaceae bacterium]